MNFERLLAVLEEELAGDIENEVLGPGHHLRFTFAVSEDVGRAIVKLIVRRGDEDADIKEQDMSLAHENLELFEEARARTFARGVRLALVQCNPANFMPSDFLDMDIVAANLKDSALVRDVLLDEQKRAEVMGEVAVLSFAKTNGLPSTGLAQCWEELYPFVREGDVPVHVFESAIRALVANDRTYAIPVLLRVLEDWMATTRKRRGALWWYTPDGRNAPYVIAGLLEPLLTKATSPAERAALDSLREAGMFDPRNEKIHPGDGRW
jgi:hypothetical protein